jgi:soluble epoxide hydrolase/lipid-phosphate phosphatase
VNYFPERVAALVVLAMGYMAPQPKFDLQQVNDRTKSMFGYEMYGYWHFMAKEGTADLLQARVGPLSFTPRYHISDASVQWDSFFSMAFPCDPTLWKTDVAPINAAEAWIKAQKSTPLPSYIDEAVSWTYPSMGNHFLTARTQEKKKMSTNLQKHGLKAALNWYKLGVTDLMAKDDAGVRIFPVLPRGNH